MNLPGSSSSSEEENRHKTKKEKQEYIKKKEEQKKKEDLQSNDKKSAEAEMKPVLEKPIKSPEKDAINWRNAMCSMKKELVTFILRECRGVKG